MYVIPMFIVTAIFLHHYNSTTNDHVSHINYLVNWCDKVQDLRITRISFDVKALT